MFFRSGNNKQTGTIGIPKKTTGGDNMIDSKQSCPQNPGVYCGVISCKYHTKNNLCTAEKINVQSENAVRKAETFCSTFAPKASF
jgi:hypothetical protein